MKVKRVYTREVDAFKAGDQIKVGKYTATAVKKTSERTIFLLDQYLDKAYTHKDLIGRLNRDLRGDKNFDEIRDRIIPWKNGEAKGELFRVPYAGEMFAGTSEDEYMRNMYEADIDGKFLAIWPCMKDRRNRIADREGDPYEWGWLMNRLRDVVSSTNFAFVNSNGFAYYYSASNSLGVRPAFQL